MSNQAVLHNEREDFKLVHCVYVSLLTNFLLDL